MTITTSATPHLFWITSRAAGIASLVLASLAVSIGLTMSLRFMRRRGPELTTLHEALSLATLVALAVHGLSLLGDHFLSASLADIALPFAWSYKTIWTSIGIIGGWGLVFLGLSYYARRTIGVNRWRKLHRLTALAWIAGIVHTLGEGTDAGQIWFLAMLSIVAVPAIALLLVRHLTEEAPRPVPSPGPERREPPAAEALAAARSAPRTLAGRP
jgi:sulfoxide reductase heme-binding subunit YedZ